MTLVSCGILQTLLGVFSNKIRGLLIWLITYELHNYGMLSKCLKSYSFELMHCDSFLKCTCSKRSKVASCSWAKSLN